MKWENINFGPGPQPISNEWLNRFQDQVESNRNVLRSFGAGVVWGCKVTFVPGSVYLDPKTNTYVAVQARIEVAEGGAIAGGVYHEIPATVWERQWDDDAAHWYWVSDDRDPIECDDISAHGIYIDQEGQITLETNNTGSSGWPRTTPDYEERDLPVLAGGMPWEENFTEDSTSLDYWTWQMVGDMRRFVREKPNGASLVVGDTNQGADFDSIQQALDYLGACDLGDNDVPRRIVVTTTQVLAEPLRVRCPGVIIEGVKNESEPPRALETSSSSSLEQILDDPVLIRWAHSRNRAFAGDGAAIDVGGHPDVSIRGLHFVHEVEGMEFNHTWACIHNPGDRFELRDCVFGRDWYDNDYEDSLMAVAVNFEALVTEGVRIVNNRAFGLNRGLIGFTNGVASSGGTLWGMGMGCLKHALVEGNYVALNEIPKPGEPDEENDGLCADICGGEDAIWPWTPGQPATWSFAIDMGVDPDECLYNAVRDNVIERCLNGIRVGRMSTVRGNAIRGCILFGVVATNTGLPDVPNIEHAPEWMARWEGRVGATDITSNHIELGPFPNIPFWRAGIRLEMHSCQVVDNTIIVAADQGCGVVQGPFDLGAVAPRLLAGHMALLYPGRHTVTGNNIVMNPVLPDGTIHRAQITRLGIGVALMSIHNRISDNGIFHARGGIFTTAYNTITGNVITPAVEAIYAWACNTVSANTIGWFPHAEAISPWSKATGGATGAIMVSIDNTVQGNSVTCGADDPTAEPRPAAIYVDDWQERLFGEIWWKLFDSDLWGDPIWDEPLPQAARLMGKRSGGNTIANAQLCLHRKNGFGAILPFEEQITALLYRLGIQLVSTGVTAVRVVLQRIAELFGQIWNPKSTKADAQEPIITWWELAEKIRDFLSKFLLRAYYNVDGMVLNGTYDGNIVTGTQIWYGIRGLIVDSGSAMVSGCAIQRTRDVGLDLVNGPSSKISGCSIFTLGRLADKNTGMPLSIREDSAGSVVNDCILWQAGLSLNEDWMEQHENMQWGGPRDTWKVPLPTTTLWLSTGREVMYHPPCVVQLADNVSINDCTIVNWGSMGIFWGGDWGECGGCWFFARSDLNKTPLLPNLYYEQDPHMMNYDRAMAIAARRYPAIYFARTYISEEQIYPTDKDFNFNHYYPDADTQGNLVWGAHMLNCQPDAAAYCFGQISKDQVAAQFMFSSSIYYANFKCLFHPKADLMGLLGVGNPFPPVYNAKQKRTTNRVYVESCYRYGLFEYAPDHPDTSELTPCKYTYSIPIGGS